MTQEEFEQLIEKHLIFLANFGMRATLDFDKHNFTGVNFADIDFTGIYMGGCAVAGIELTTAQVAQVLGVTPQRVGAMRKAGQLQYVKRGGRYLHPVEAVGKRQAELLAWRARMLKE